MSTEAVSFTQIATAVTPRGAVLYGVTSAGAVYEYNFSREVWVPLRMRGLPESALDENIVGLRGPGAGFDELGAGTSSRRD